VRREAGSGDATEVGDQQSRGPGQAFDEDEGAALHELAACMAPMLQRLPQVYREAITLTDLRGLNQADAARHSGVSLSGMKSRVQRGRRQLRAVLEDCCRIQLDRRGGIVAYDRRAPDACDPCGGCR
jgi:RNA polymerase sigma-70 factor, ECF subfamily